MTSRTSIHSYSGSPPGPGSERRRPRARATRRRSFTSPPEIAGVGERAVGGWRGARAAAADQVRAGVSACALTYNSPFSSSSSLTCICIQAAPSRSGRGTPAPTRRKQQRGAPTPHADASVATAWDLVALTALPPFTVFTRNAGTTPNTARPPPSCLSRFRWEPAAGGFVSAPRAASRLPSESRFVTVETCCGDDRVFSPPQTLLAVVAARVGPAGHQSLVGATRGGFCLRPGSSGLRAVLARRVASGPKSPCVWCEIGVRVESRQRDLATRLRLSCAARCAAAPRWGWPAGVWSRARDLSSGAPGSPGRWFS
jgi:hypothetical protein